MRVLARPQGRGGSSRRDELSRGARRLQSHSRANAHIPGIERSRVVVRRLRRRSSAKPGGVDRVQGRAHDGCSSNVGPGRAGGRFYSQVGDYSTGMKHKSGPQVSRPGARARSRSLFLDEPTTMAWTTKGARRDGPKLSRTSRTKQKGVKHDSCRSHLLPDRSSTTCDRWSRLDKGDEIAGGRARLRALKQPRGRV